MMRIIASCCSSMLAADPQIAGLGNPRKGNRDDQIWARIVISRGASAQHVQEDGQLS